MPPTRRKRGVASAPRSRHRVVLVAYDRLALFELAIATEVFGLPRPELAIPWYAFSVCALERGPLRATGAIEFRSKHGLGLLNTADTIIVPGWRDPLETPPSRLLSALRRAHARGARLVSICSGAFVLAATGLLDGKRATTHWRYTDILRERYPSIRVEPDVLYVEQGRIFTSAGSAAGIDLCLHLVRLDYGAEVANQVARRLVVPPHRDGGQAQYIAEPVPKEPGGGLAKALEWALAHLDETLGVNDLAGVAALSPRTFLRRFHAELGTTPHAWLNRQRVLTAQRLLEGARASVEEVAASVGFGTAQTLRLHFRRVLRTSPTAYRRHFSTGRGSEPRRRARR
ncbi:MAG TPA: transcriptional regulator FtrA [Candidatus Eisenbacteria bacterium]|nr:transcriptional regulator FtrA [Candidatus Eisenbacteria bacterium]